MKKLARKASAYFVLKAKPIRPGPGQIPKIPHPMPKIALPNKNLNGISFELATSNSLFNSGFLIDFQTKILGIIVNKIIINNEESNKP